MSKIRQFLFDLSMWKIIRILCLRQYRNDVPARELRLCRVDRGTFMLEKFGKFLLKLRRIICLFLLTTVLGTQAASATDIGEFRLQLKTFYFNRDKEEDNPDSEALAQTMKLGYQSPYWRELARLNLDFFGSLKLIGDRGKGGTGLLRDDADGSQNSYAKFGEANLEFRLPNEGQFKVGRMQLSQPLKYDDTSRALPATSQAADISLNLAGTVVYGLATDRGSPKADDGFGRYRDNTGDEFVVYIAGAKHTFANGLFVEASAGHANDVMNRAYLNARLPWKIDDDASLLLDAYQYFGWNDGAGALTNVGPDYDSSLSSLTLQFRNGNAKLALGAQKVSGDAHQISWDGGVQDDGTYKNWLSVTRLDFDRGGERSWQARFDYDFKDILDGLRVMARYTSGDNIDRNDGREGSEWERDLVVGYSPPFIENLSFAWINAYVKSTETFDSEENRLILNYSLTF